MRYRDDNSELRACKVITQESGERGKSVGELRKKKKIKLLDAGEMKSAT